MPNGTKISHVQGWDEFTDALRDLPDRLLSKLPSGLRDDPQIQQEVGRIVLTSLAVASIEAIGADGDHPCFLPNQNFILDLPMPNADTTYRVAHITPGGVYRLRGKSGSLRMSHLSQIGTARGERSAIDLNDLKTDADGRFDLLLSLERPADHAGDFWLLLPTTNKLLLRLVSADWGQEHDPTISIERLDCPLRKPRTPAPELERRLRALPQAIALLPTMFVDRVAKLREEGFINVMKALDLSQMGGVSGQAYFDAAYELGDNEALLLEAKSPLDCTYFSLILGNDLHETTDWYSNPSSLNDAQANVDADGVLHVVISAQDCGAPNWLDTAGYPRGLLQGRWICATPMQTPTLQVMALSEVRRALPPDTVAITPSQRAATIRTRRLHLQQRPLW